MPHNENSRVKIPALVHFTRLGYQYISLKKYEGVVDSDTNILIDVLRDAINRINATALTTEDVQKIVNVLKAMLENNDLGREFYSILLNGYHVFIIKNTTDVPYYLVESYTDTKYRPEPPKKRKTVQAFHIYTRVMDNNTPIDKSADVHDVEYLWKKRFGLLQTPLEQIKIFLRQPEEWTEENSCYYHKLFPQYTIAIEYEEDEDEDEDGFNKNGHRSFYHHWLSQTVPCLRLPGGDPGF